MTEFLFTTSVPACMATLFARHCPLISATDRRDLLCIQRLSSICRNFALLLLRPKPLAPLSKILMKRLFFVDLSKREYEVVSPLLKHASYAYVHYMGELISKETSWRLEKRLSNETGREW